jgi:hypothetical protein
MTKISAKLRVAIFSGAVGLLPSIVFADSGSNGAAENNGRETPEAVPDHAAAEAGSQREMTRSGNETTGPDHAAAEDRGQADPRPPSAETAAGVPDHATAERRGVQAE